MTAVVEETPSELVCTAAFFSLIVSDSRETEILAKVSIAPWWSANASAKLLFSESPPAAFLEFVVLAPICRIAAFSRPHTIYIILKFVNKIMYFLYIS